MLKRTTVFLLASFLTVPAVTAQNPDVPKVGDVAPGWKQLTGTDDKPHSLDDLADFDAVVVCFTCNSCPYSVDYEDRLIALQKKFTDQNAKAAIVAINSNGVPADDLDRMKQRAAEKKFNFAYLKDESQDVAKAFDAIYTPEFYVLNRHRRIIYRGAMDDTTKADDVKVKYVELAVDAALRNKMPEVTAVGARGCAIRFKRKRR
jgi:peroxiredoxin